MIWKLINGLRKAKFAYSDDQLGVSSSTKMFWWNGRQNFGDALNPLIASLSGATGVEWVPHTYPREHYLVIGSIVQKANAHSIIWGSGFIDSHLTPYRKPRAVLGVRGPLTRRRLLDLGVSCPPVYGDPALLMPDYYAPTTRPQYELGIVAHYSDKSNAFFRQNFDERVLVIDTEQPSCEAFVRDVLSCKRIVSSSLHGLIVADAYGLPNARVAFSRRSVFGGDFKFFDYFLSVSRELTPATLIADSATADTLLQLDFQQARRIDISAMRAANPFK